MGNIKIPKKPELFQRKYQGKPGKWVIRYPTVKFNGGRISRSIALNTKDKKEAIGLFKTWTDGGNFERLVTEDQAAYQAHKIGRTNGQKTNLPIPYVPKVTRKYQKKTKENTQDLKKVFKLQTTLLHAIAQTTELLGVKLNLDVDDE